jgi:uncharacterized membrane protein YfcA
MAVIFLPALILGNWIGARGFKSTDPTTFRKWVLILLAVLAVLSAAKGIVAYWQDQSFGVEAGSLP